MTNFDETTHPGWNDQLAYPELTVGCAVCILSRIHPVVGERTSYNELPADTVSKGHRLTYAISSGELATTKLYVRGEGQDCVEAAQCSPQQIDWRTVLKADDFVAWCDQNKFEHPWSKCKQSDGCSLQGKELDSRERETLLKIIAGLAELAGIDLRPETKGHAEAASIIEELKARRVDISQRTVADKLAAARQLIAPKGPGRIHGSK